jgi:hypothetical protein
MGERKALSKRTRFEIFKRDGFICAYCGRSPPDVILEVDHIVAVANEGENEETNLITSCRDCNRGKSDRPLERISPSLQAQIEDQRERVEQIQAYNAMLLEVRDRELEVVDQIAHVWYDGFCDPGQRGKWSFGVGRVPSIRRFLKELSPTEILDAIDVTVSAASQRSHLDTHCTADACDDQERFRYFCGVCWTKIKRKNEKG